MRLRPPSVGENVQVKGRTIPFSLWPTSQGRTREKLQWTLFSSDPWFLIEDSIRGLPEAARSEAYAFLHQAHDFYKAATGSAVTAAKPLLLYYAFLNLAKCFVVHKAGQAIQGRVDHGLSEKLPTTVGSINGELHVLRSKDASSAFAKFSNALGNSLPVANAPNGVASVRSQDFLAQVLIGHRVWSKGDDTKERFISLQDIQFRHDAVGKTIWLRARVYRDDLSRFDYRQRAVMDALNLDGRSKFDMVSCEEQSADGRDLAEFELSVKRVYPNRPSEELNALARSIKNNLWRSVTSYPPYRKYYAQIRTSSQIPLSQLQALYLATYYFGSITRYKPLQLTSILESNIGPFVQEFFTNQPSQILYLMASEFVEQEVTKAAIV